MQFASPLSLINTDIVSHAFFHWRVLPRPVRINQRDCLECLLVIHFFNQIKQLCPIYRLLKHWIKWRVRAGGPWAERDLLTVSVNKAVLTHTLTDRPQWVSWYREGNRKTSMIALYWPNTLFSLLKRVLTVSWNTKKQKRVACGSKQLLKLCLLQSHPCNTWVCVFFSFDRMMLTSSAFISSRKMLVIIKNQLIIKPWLFMSTP